MPDALNRSLLLRLRGRSRRGARRPPDPAEMGTAFGLEYILDQAVESEAAAQPIEGNRAAAWFRRWMADRGR